MNSHRTGILRWRRSEENASQSQHGGSRLTLDAVPRSHSTADFSKALSNGVVLVFDGATGTSLQQRGLSADDFGGSQFEGCNENLNLTRPDVVADLHRSFLDVGVDVVETNTFGAFGIPLGEYGIADRAYQIAGAGP